MFRASRRESLERSLDNSLRADINPRTRGHLPVHHQPRALEFVELLPVRPMPHKVRIRNQHSRRVIVRLEHANWLSRLHQQRLIILQLPQCRDDRMVSLPTPRRTPGAAVHHKVFGALSNLFIQIVHQHAHGSFLRPAFASDLVPTRCSNGHVSCGGDLGFDRHS